MDASDLVGMLLGALLALLVTLIVVSTLSVRNRPSILDTIEQKPTRIEWRGRVWLPVEEEK